MEVAIPEIYITRFYFIHHAVHDFIDLVHFDFLLEIFPQSIGQQIYQKDYQYQDQGRSIGNRQLASISVPLVEMTYR